MPWNSSSGSPTHLDRFRPVGSIQTISPWISSIRRHSSTQPPRMQCVVRVIVARMANRDYSASVKMLTVPDVIHRVPPLVEEARRFLGRCERSARPRVRVWRGGCPEGRRGFAAVYPGSFDPWTLAHDAILRATLRRVKGPVLVLLDLDTIDKPAHAAPLAERLAILALHLADQRRVAIGVSTHGRFLEKARALGRATFVVGQDTWERVFAPRYYQDPERDLAELRRRARFLVAPRGGRGTGDLRLSRVDQARSATIARRAFAAGRLPWDQLAPDVLLACWQLGLYGVKRLLPVWVVTAFLERDGQVLLVKRGQQVGTYRGVWSGVSGYLDWPVKRLSELLARGPGRWGLRQAVKEIHEETRIGAKSIRLVRAGSVLAAADPAHRREWRVRPFLFRLAPGAEPRLDWENTECAWVPPWALLEMPTVPKLIDALGRALGGWRRWCEEQVRALERDRRSGAMMIATRFLSTVVLAERVRARVDPVRCARRLANAHPMGPLAWIRDRLAEGVAASRLRAELGRQSTRLAEAAWRRLRAAKALATYSFSSTVWVVASRLAKPLTIIPDAEGHGRRLRDEIGHYLPSDRVPIRLSPRPPSDAVFVIGCDAVLPDRSIINARGTEEAIREAGLPVVVLAQRCKFMRSVPPLRRGFERVPAEALRDAEFITG